MTTKQVDAYTVLQQRWLRHQELRAAGAPISVLYASRRELDAARLQARAAA